MAEKATLISRKTEKTTAFRLSLSSPSVEFKSTEVTEEQWQAPDVRQGAPTFAPEPSDVISDVEYERELVRVFGPKSNPSIVMPSLARPETTLAGRTDVREIWYDYLEHRFRPYWKPPARLDIRRFVDQFRPELRDGVLRMLRSVRFYSEGDFDFHYRRFYERNRDLFNERTAICPLDMSGGSASLMHYISSHSVGSAQHASSLHDALKLRRDGQVDRIVLLDDALISGTQATHILDQYFRVSSTNRKHVAPLSEEQKQVLMRGDILMLFLMATGIGKAKLTKELRSSYPHLNVQVESIAQMDSRALFKDRTYVFGAMAQEAENLFGNVGHELLANRAAEKEEAAQDRESYRRRNAIGFGNDQLLIVYWYNP